METIKQVLVVEGKHDVATLKKYFNCHCIITNGSSCDEDTLQLIGKYVDNPGVIVFSDPDGPGEKIRKKIMDRYPGVKHAYIDKQKAKTDKKVGVEHAHYQALKQALDNIAIYDINKPSSLTINDLIDLGLIGQENSEALREKLSKIYPIGHTNGKTCLKRCSYLGLSKEDIRKALYGKDSNI